MRWNIPEDTNKTNINLFTNYPLYFRNILLNRSINSKTQLDTFVGDNIDYHDPFSLYGIQKAIDRIILAKNSNQKIYIYGDYDVDGISATSILWDFLFRKLGINVLPYIPSRFDEGYGMSETGLDKIMKDNAQLVITVDCGIRDIDLIKKYSNLGLEFIVTDHHTLPTDDTDQPIISKKAISVIHPRHPKSKYPFKDICGTAVAWKLICAINTKLALNFDVNEYIDLVSLATVTDIMPLVDENRIILKRGLERMKITKNIGLQSLIRESNIDIKELDTYHYGFVLGPRLNAAGRIAHALDGVRLLTTHDKSKADQLAKHLSDLNLTRQEMTRDIQGKAISMIDDTTANIHIVIGKDWSEGIVGLVAGKLQEIFYRPVFVGTSDGKLITGSARSIPGFNVTEALQSASDYLERWGGHAQAAGFTLKVENIDQFKSALKSFADSHLAPKDFDRQLDIDAIITIDNFTVEDIELIDMLKPFGYHNSKPLLLLRQVEIINIREIGKEKNHIKLSAVKNNKYIDIIGFNKAKAFQGVKPHDIIDIVGNLDKNYWKGTTRVQFNLRDFKLNENR